MTVSMDCPKCGESFRPFIDGHDCEGILQRGSDMSNKYKMRCIWCDAELNGLGHKACNFRPEEFDPPVYTIKRPAWEVLSVTFTGDHFYPFRVVGINHYKVEKGEHGEFIWRVPGFDPLAYDLSGATFHGLTDLSPTDEP